MLAKPCRTYKEYTMHNAQQDVLLLMQDFVSRKLRSHDYDQLAIMCEMIAAMCEAREQ
jgi:hypothetical protein